jgi:hypothetical protein
MTLEKEYSLDLLNKDTVSIAIREFITTDDGRKLQVGDTARCCFANSENDRMKLKEMLPANYYVAVSAVWGETPTFIDVEHPRVD